VTVEWESHVIPLQGRNLVIIKAARGYLMCGYLNLEAAERFGDAAAVVTGVSSADDALKAEVRGVTIKARELGVKPGMRGEEALKLMS